MLMDIKRVPISKDKLKFGKSANADVLSSSPTDHVVKEAPTSDKAVPAPVKNNATKPTQPAPAVAKTPPVPIASADTSGVASQAPFDAPVAPAPVVVSPTPANQTPSAAKSASNTMPHKSHFALSIAIAVGAVVVLIGGLVLILMSQKKAVAPTPSAAKVQHYSDASTEIDQVNADIKDMNDRFNDKPLDMTEN